MTLKLPGGTVVVRRSTSTQLDLTCVLSCSMKYTYTENYERIDNEVPGGIGLVE